MAVNVKIEPDKRYFQDRDGSFRAVENLSMTASTPVYPATLHQMRRTMIFADDRAHAVVALDKSVCVTRNAEMSAVLISHNEPTESTWKALKSHMDAENSTAEIAREAKSRALIERRRKSAEAR
jgi:ribosomal protein S21